MRLALLCVLLIILQQGSACLLLGLCGGRGFGEQKRQGEQHNHQKNNRWGQNRHERQAPSQCAPPAAPQVAPPVVVNPVPPPCAPYIAPTTPKKVPVPTPPKQSYSLGPKIGAGKQKKQDAPYGESKPNPQTGLNSSNENIVLGDFNALVEGSTKNKIKGNSNKVDGDQNQVVGSHNDVCGDENLVQSNKK